MAANYVVAKDGWLFGGHRFAKGDPVSLDALERAGVGKTESFLRLGIIEERKGYRHDPKHRKVRDHADRPAMRSGKKVKKDE